jgi:spore coat protein U-like protein
MAACNVSATTLPFATYNPASPAATDATGTVTVSCTVLVAVGLSWTVTMSKGTSSTYSPRVLSSGAATLSYNIYTTSARTTVWGDGTGGTGDISDSVVLAIGTNVSTYTMYGRIPPLQDVRAGAYSDAIVVTVSY